MGLTGNSGERYVNQKTSLWASHRLGGKLIFKIVTQESCSSPQKLWLLPKKWNSCPISPRFAQEISRRSRFQAKPPGGASNLSPYTTGY